MALKKIKIIKKKNKKKDKKCSIGYHLWTKSSNCNSCSLVLTAAISSSSAQTRREKEEGRLKTYVYQISFKCAIIDGGSLKGRERAWPASLPDTDAISDEGIHDTSGQYNSSLSFSTTSKKGTVDGRLRSKNDAPECRMKEALSPFPSSLGSFHSIPFRSKPSPD